MRNRALRLATLFASMLVCVSTWAATGLGNVTGVGGGQVQIVDSNGNPVSGPSQVQQLDTLTLSGTGSALNDYVIGGSQGQDTTGYNSLVVQNLTIGSGNTVVCEWSSNRTTFQGLPIWALSSTQMQSIYSASGAMTAANVYVSPVYLQYVRCRVSVYSSGTWQANAALRMTPFPLAAQQYNVVGTASTDSAASGNPVQAGCVVQTSISTSDTTNNWMVPCAADRSRGLIIRPYASTDASWNYAAASGGITASGAVTLHAAQAANVKNYLVSITVQNTSGSVAPEIRINDGASGTALWRMIVPTNYPPTQITFPVPLSGTAATLMEFAVGSTPTGGAVYVNANGYGAP